MWSIHLNQVLVHLSLESPFQFIHLTHVSQNWQTSDLVTFLLFSEFSQLQEHDVTVEIIKEPRIPEELQLIVNTIQ